MTFSSGALDPASASDRFDRMLLLARELPFAKQPVVEHASGTVVGYVGVDWFELEGERRLELGYRLISHARGKGYATEAGAAILAIAATAFQGELLTIIHHTNLASANTARKLGFSFWKQALIDGESRDLSRLVLPER